MKLKDFIFSFVFILISLFIFSPYTHQIFVNLTTSAPYIMGFIKTMVLASMGEMLVKRIKTTYYFKDKGLVLKALVWGLLGMVFVFVFALFEGGIQTLTNGRTFFQNDFLNRLVYAFLVSLSMNLIFAPTLMIFHRVTDSYIDLAEGSMKKLFHTPLKNVVEKIDFKFFFSFVIVKTIPFFWIPAHTITFILPSVYRVLMASYLSIALGILLTIKKSPQLKNENK